MTTAPRDAAGPGPGPRLGALVLAVFILAAVPRLAVVWTGWARYASDTGSYVVAAESLIAGRGYTDGTGKPYSWRPPTYPLFLAAVFGVAGNSLRPVEVTQALLAAAVIAGLAVWVARRYGRGRGTAAGILLALDPLLIPVPAFVLTEALGTLLVVGIVICLERGLATRRAGPLLLAGLLGGAAALNTPITLLLIPWLLLTAWVIRSPRRPDWRSAALALSLTVLCVGAWTTRNMIAKGQAVVVRDNGFASLVWATTEYDFNWVPYPSDPEWAALERKLKALTAGHTAGEAHAIFLRAALQNFRDHPFLVLKRVAKGTAWFWIEVPGQQALGPRPWLRWLTLAFHAGQLLAFLSALALTWRTGRLREWALWLSTILYFALFLSLMWPIPRYYVPLLPVMDIFIVAGLALAPRGKPSARGASEWPPSGGGKRER